MFDALLPERSAEDIVSGIVRIRLGEREYALPELPMEATDSWAASIDSSLVGLLGIVDKLGETSGLAPLFVRAREFEGELLDTLLAYDAEHVLPPREELRRIATHTQVLFAVMGVWATTASPLGALVLGIVRAVPTTSDSAEREPISGSLATLASNLATSVDGSPGDSSSTPPRTPSDEPTPSSSAPSSPPVSDTSSPTTERPTTPGGGRHRRSVANRSASREQLSSVP